MTGLPAKVETNLSIAGGRRSSVCVWAAHSRCRFACSLVNVLAPMDLVVFKALFNRAKDWVDIASICDFDPLSVREARSALTDLVGFDDDRIDRLNDLLAR